MKVITEVVYFEVHILCHVLYPLQSVFAAQMGLVHINFVGKSKVMSTIDKHIMSQMDNMIQEQNTNRKWVGPRERERVRVRERERERERRVYVYKHPSSPVSICHPSSPVSMICHPSSPVSMIFSVTHMFSA